MAAIRRAAPAFSANATPALLERLDSVAFRKALSACCSASGWATRPAAALLDELRENVYSSELLHTFDGSRYPDMSIEIGLYNESDYFPSLWQLLFLGYYGAMESYTDTAVNDAAERGIFRLAPFSASDSAGNGLPADYTEASSRLNYVALNWMRIDVGNRGWPAAGSVAFGNVTAVFSPYFWADSVAVAPSDTGRYTVNCNETYQNASGNPHRRGSSMNCTALPRAGVSGAMDHVILDNEILWSAQGSPLATLFGRWHGDSEVYTNVTGHEWYLEADIVGTIMYEDRGLKLLVGSFPALFGTKRGALLQLWATKRDVALAWALGDGSVSNDYGHRHGPHRGPPPPPPPPFRSRARMLDPQSTRLLNTSAVGGVAANFSSLWSRVAAARDPIGNLSLRAVLGFWGEAQRSFPAQLFVSVPAPRACDDWNACLGVGGHGRCVCYS